MPPLTELPDRRIIFMVPIAGEAAACESRAGQLVYAVSAARSDAPRRSRRSQPSLHRWRHAYTIAPLQRTLARTDARFRPRRRTGRLGPVRSAGRRRREVRRRAQRLGRFLAKARLDAEARRPADVPRRRLQVHRRLRELPAPPGAAQTSDEKLLIYYRPLRYKIDFVNDFYTAHLVQDNEIRKKGKKEIVRQKKKVVEFRPKQKQPLGPFYIKNTISLKGLDPGEYELTVILRDELDKGAAPSKQLVKFKVIRAGDPRAKEPAKKADEPPAGR